MGAATAAGEPIGQYRGVPLYRHGTAPAHLRTRTRLAAIRLQPAPGQQPVCYLAPYYHPDERRALYEPADALQVVRSVGDQWAWRARRTCPRCGQVGEYLTCGRPCAACRRTDRERAARVRERTCDGCARYGKKPYPQLAEGWYVKRLCRACRAARRRELDALLRAAIRCAGGCGKLVATRRQVLDWALANHRAIRTFTPRRCPPCLAAHAAEEARRDAERETRRLRAGAEHEARAQAEREARRREVADLAAWAAEILADPDTVILDTETTGLHDDARIIEISVTTTAGEILLDTLVNPGEPIPAEASAIHGITDTDVTTSPAFGALLPQLEKALHGKRVLIYNADYDTARIQRELEIHLGGARPGQRVFDQTEVRPAAAWMAKAEWVDAMVPYSDWVGDWSQYWGNYRRQPLGGGHRAAGDCRAVIERLREMSRSALTSSPAFRREIPTVGAAIRQAALLLPEHLRGRALQPHPAATRPRRPRTP